MMFKKSKWQFGFIIALEEETVWTKQQLYQVSDILSIDTEQWINARKVQYLQSCGNPGFEMRFIQSPKKISFPVIFTNLTKDSHYYY